MLDIQKIRDKQADVEQALLKRMDRKSFDLDKILKLDEKRRHLINQAERVRSEQKKISKSKDSYTDQNKKAKFLKTEIKSFQDELEKVTSQLKILMLELPNLPSDDVPAGGKENNQVIGVFGKKIKFNYPFKDHIKLATALGLIDYQRAVKMSGSGFWAYVGQGALLEWALLNYFVDFHRKNNYTFIIPPYLLTENSAYISGHLPRFKDDLFWTQDKSCLNATAEMMLANYHAGEILAETELPKKYFAFSACFRREAGGYGAGERGMVRGHQFNKIELFQITKPEDSSKAFTELQNIAERLMHGLELHYRTTLLAAGDASSTMAKTVDIEVWLPSIDGYKEVSSVSSAADFQARRGNIKYKDSRTKQNELVHTLNASGLATSRLLPAILEQFQQADGSIKLPKVLHKYFGKKVISNGK